MNHIKKRLASFDCKKDSLGTKLSQHEIRRNFIVPMVHTFEDKVFALSKSSFVQYMPLLIIAYANRIDEPLAAKACKTLTE